MSERSVKPAWYRSLANYRPDTRKAVWQLINTLVPYVVLWAAMAYIVLQHYPYWIALLLALPAGGFMVRIFIFLHDCGHGSFTPSRQANNLIGHILGFLTFTPYEDWRHAHSIHHSTAGNLDRRGVGDVWTMTMEEYLASSWLKRLGYRLFRNPAVMFGIGPSYIFLISNRLPHKNARKKDRYSVYMTNLALLAIIFVASLTIGFRTYVMVQLPIVIFGTTMGVWMFYIQHQYEDMHWFRQEEWDLVTASLRGSSYYKLPKVLQWITGNIGLHHIHHLNPRIPNYYLQRCYDEIPELQQIKPLTVRKSLKSLFLNLWDEKRQQLVGFWALRKTRST